MKNKQFLHSFENQSFTNLPEGPLVLFASSGSYLSCHDSPEQAESWIRENPSTPPGYWARFDELPPVLKLCAVVYEDIKNKAKSDEKQISFPA